jgi:hypothetical protein
MRSPAKERGFVLLIVLLIVAMLASTVTLALRNANTTLHEAVSAKTSEQAYAALGRGLAKAVGELETLDTARLIDPSFRHDIY